MPKCPWALLPNQQPTIFLDVSIKPSYLLGNSYHAESQMSSYIINITCFLSNGGHLGLYGNRSSLSSLRGKPKDCRNGHLGHNMSRYEMSSIEVYGVNFYFNSIPSCLIGPFPY